MNKILHIRLLKTFLCLAFVVAMAGQASAVTTFNIAADQAMLSLPGGDVPVWGFRLIDTNIDGTVIPGDNTTTVPGEPLVVPPGEATVNINLINNLPEPVSLMILGQSLSQASGPVWTDGLSSNISSNGSRTSGDFTSRVRSFSHETAANGGVATYTWTNFKAGTYLLQSGTNPAKQVQMGLYSAIIKDSGPNEVYPGVSYDKDLILVYSELDPVINNAIASGSYGPNGTISNSLKRKPKYFLINGMAYEENNGLDPLNDNPLGTNDRVLLRFINAGYNLHVPELMSNYVDIVAEDGNPSTYHKTQYSLEMPAGKTFDVILEPSAEGDVAVYDAAMGLANPGSALPGGMLAYLNVIESCLADINNDGTVGIPDFAILSSAFGSNPASPNWNVAADLNGDGVVGMPDFAILSSEFGRTGCP